MSNILIALWQYAWILSIAICVFFAVRCFVLNKILKKEYGVNSSQMNSRELEMLMLSIGVKEVKFLVRRLIRARICEQGFILATAMILAFYYFFPLHQSAIK